MVKAGLVRPTAVLVLTPSRQGNQRNVIELGAFPNSSSDFVAVHAGHSQIEQYNGRMVRLDRRQCRGTAIGDLDLCSQEFEEQAHAACRVAIIIDDEDALPRQDRRRRTRSRRRARRGILWS